MQTAVLDNVDSEDPVELPRDVPGFDLFLELHQGRTYWCGVWLGGCGGRLIARRCTDKICHFAHVPNAGAPDSLCRRMSTRPSGSGSADHLYIKRAVTGWMAHGGLRGEARIAQDPTGEMRIGAQVTAEPSGYEPLRFVLDRAALPDPGEVPADTILGPGIDADPRILHEQGYVHRVRCIPDGVHRKVQIGTEHSNGTFDWYDFVAGTVGLDPHGLSTPAVEEIRRRRTQTVPIGVHAQDLIAKKITAAAPSPSFAATSAQPTDHTALVDALRTALADGVSVTRLQHSLDLLEAATRQGATAEENDLMRQASDELLRMRRGVGAQTPVPVPTSRSRKPRRLPALAPDRASARKPGNAAALHAPREQPRRATFEGDGLTQDSLRSAATAIRGALKKTAREQTTTTWATLKRQLGTALPRMTAAERVDVLIRVDQQTPKDQPLLSSLIAAGDPSLTAAYREIAAALGLDAPEDDDGLRDVLEADVQQVHLHWSRP
ncbi:hypothetical protein [Streptomyces sp. NPDC095817]|uniref:hypothetical protein n=1 Tax=Streptomyces sp. NPDC095817 TaxID=3155082 RepID=UPI0033245D67